MYPEVAGLGWAIRWAMADYSGRTKKGEDKLKYRFHCDNMTVVGAAAERTTINADGKLHRQAAGLPPNVQAVLRR
jgi:hypothetical protein